MTNTKQLARRLAFLACIAALGGGCSKSPEVGAAMSGTIIPGAGAQPNATDTGASGNPSSNPGAVGSADRTPARPGDPPAEAGSGGSSQGAAGSAGRANDPSGAGAGGKLSADAGVTDQVPDDDQVDGPDAAMQTDAGAPPDEPPDDDDEEDDDGI